MFDPLPITGVGLVTPLGRTAPATFAALLRGERITDHTRVERSGWPLLPRVTSLAIEAATEAIRQAGWQAGDEAAVVVCTSKGPVEEWLSPAAAPTSGNADGGAFGMATVSAALVNALRIGNGPRLTLSAACAGGLQGLARAALLVRSGEARRVLVVAAEASVHPLFLASFRRLGVLPSPGEVCRPFDVNRSGFLMSEAAAAICLDVSPSARPLAAVSAFATGADATSLTGSDPHAHTLGRLVAAVSPDHPFDLVHAHGTGTRLNDAAELSALHANLYDGGVGTTLYSHKAAIGHTLGAAGLVSAVLNVMCHSEQVIPPNVNTHDPLPTPMRLLPRPIGHVVRHSLATAAGFGGGVTAVTFTSS